MKKRPVGIFDSGVGGLSVLRHVRAELPYEDVVYVADQAHVPYGPRPQPEIQQFSQTITRFLLDQGAKVIVVACNTASAAALAHLRTTFPHVPFVGMEPAIKPGAAVTRTGKVGVLATSRTFDSQKYASLLIRFANGVEVLEDPCVGLVDAIERGEVDAAATHSLLQSILHPMLAQGIDTLILGCTHFPFVQPLIRQIIGPDVTIIDPAPAVARQTRRLLAEKRLATSSTTPGHTLLLTTGEPEQLRPLTPSLLGRAYPVERVSVESMVK
jgi:glutamate racemase